jgi:hypothetical protein
MEGLAEYERGAWDPGDLAALREAVRLAAIPKMSALDGDGSAKDPRLVHALGHAAFDFIESRWGKPGVRQFIFWLRQTSHNGGDPFEAALQVSRDAFDQAFARYLRERFAGSAGQFPAGRVDAGAALRIEGEVIALRSPAAPGLACIELWVEDGGPARRRWAVECGESLEPTLIGELRPGDKVIVTGPARTPGTQRMGLDSVLRPSDGFTWRAHAG